MDYIPEIFLSIHAFSFTSMAQKSVALAELAAQGVEASA